VLCVSQLESLRVHFILATMSHRHQDLLRDHTADGHRQHAHGQHHCVLIVDLPVVT
jgi:hypothetical protein